jgi:hypothetical protein
MFLLSLTTLAVASLSAFLSLNTQEDVFKAAMGCTAIISFLLTLFIAPWALKLSIVAVPLMVNWLSNRAMKRSLNY